MCYPGHVSCAADLDIVPRTMDMALTLPCLPARPHHHHPYVSPARPYHHHHPCQAPSPTPLCPLLTLCLTPFYFPRAAGRAITCGCVSVTSILLKKKNQQDTLSIAKPLRSVFGSSHKLGEDIPLRRLINFNEDIPSGRLFTLVYMYLWLLSYSWRRCTIGWSHKQCTDVSMSGLIILEYMKICIGFTKLAQMYLVGRIIILAQVNLWVASTKVDKEVTIQFKYFVAFGQCRVKVAISLSPVLASYVG